jgi:hypothetical protein
LENDSGGHRLFIASHALGLMAGGTSLSGAVNPTVLMRFAAASPTQRVAFLPR